MNHTNQSRLSGLLIVITLIFGLQTHPVSGQTYEVGVEVGDSFDFQLELYQEVEKNNTGTFVTSTKTGIGGLELESGDDFTLLFNDFAVSTPVEVAIVTFTSETQESNMHINFNTEDFVYYTHWDFLRTDLQTYIDGATTIVDHDPDLLLFEGEIIESEQIMGLSFKQHLLLDGDPDVIFSFHYINLFEKTTGVSMYQYRSEGIDLRGERFIYSNSTVIRDGYSLSESNGGDQRLPIPQNIIVLGFLSAVFINRKRT